MKILKKLWSDEHGMVMSAEMVMLGTVGILSLTAGIGAMSTAVNDELTEMGQAFRSFNQDFEVVGFQSSFSGGARGSNGRQGGMASSKMGSSFSQTIASDQAAQNVALEYMPVRSNQRSMQTRAHSASLAAQQSFEDGATKAASLQQLEAEVFQRQAFARQLKDNQKARAAAQKNPADKEEKKRRRRDRRKQGA
jgi:hypothetical protein